MTRPELLKERSGLGNRKGLPCLTARDLLDSGIVGMWKDRKDIGASPAYARQLRERLSKRRPRSL